MPTRTMPEPKVPARPLYWILSMPVMVGAVILVAISRDTFGASGRIILGWRGRKVKDKTPRRLAHRPFGVGRFVPEGQNDISQPIYSLHPVQSRIRPLGHGLILA